MNYIGIEIAKEEFKATLNSKVLSFKNEESGFENLRRVLPSKEGEDCCVMEASGPYYLRLATFLHAHKVKVSVVNPLVIRRFCQMNLKRAKTDKVDAMQIARYGKTIEPDCWEPEPEQILHLKQLQALQELITAQKTQLTNHLDALEQCTVVNETAASILKKEIETKRKILEDISKEMKSIIDKHYGKKNEVVQTIPGIGPKTAAMLIIITHGFTRFATPQQLLSYVGLTPRIFESGKSVNRRPHITKMGTARMRQLFYLCALTAKRRNKACTVMFERLTQKGKPFKVVCVAVAAKLLRQAFAVATSEVPYNPEFSFGKKSTAA